MSREVLILDDDDDLRASLGAVLSEFYDRAWLGARSVAEVIALGPRALACELAILDINLGPDQPSGLDAYNWLMAHRFAGRIVFLTGHAQGFRCRQGDESFDPAMILRGATPGGEAASGRSRRGGGSA